MLQSSINEECGCHSFATTASKGARALESWPRYCHCSKVMPSQDSTEVIATAGLGTLRVDDPAWWWVEASNLGGLSSPVVRFNLVHISSFFLFHRLLSCYSREYSERLDSLIRATTLSLCVCMTLPGGGLRLQTSGGLVAQLLDSTLRTFLSSVQVNSYSKIEF